MSNSALHFLLMLSDSALPLGSFAFSSGLESFLAHQSHSTSQSPSTRLQSVERFLAHSVANVCSTALPYVLAAYHAPGRLPELDDEFDACSLCPVARRASVSQGRALLTIWERAFASTEAANEEAAGAIVSFASTLRSQHSNRDHGLFSGELYAHLPPLFGTVASALGLNAQDTAYVFLLTHAKTVLSAAVRAGVLGPYQSQAILASSQLQNELKQCLDRGNNQVDAEASVTVPVMDLWMGRHELLYSRIFNS